LAVHCAGDIGEEEEFSGVDVMPVSTIDKIRIAQIVNQFDIKPWQLRRLRNLVRQQLHEHRIALDHMAQVLMRKRCVQGRELDLLWQTYRGARV
jgi:hypothetical protein